MLAIAPVSLSSSGLISKYVVHTPSLSLSFSLKEKENYLDNHFHLSPFLYTALLSLHIILSNWGEENN